MKKQFDLQYYLAHPETKVVTRDNRNVRIICTDCKDPLYPIIALIDTNVIEYSAPRKANGCKFADCREHAEDLFFDLPDPVKKRIPLTYEDLLERVIKGKTMFVDYCGKGEMFCQIKYFEDEEYVTLTYNEGEDTYESLMEQGCIFVDGDPCWKEVEE